LNVRRPKVFHRSNGKVDFRARKLWSGPWTQHSRFAA
jgi:hypothetical protein